MAVTTQLDQGNGGGAGKVATRRHLQQGWHGF
jgi:hypothetical protein